MDSFLLHELSHLTIGLIVGFILNFFFKKKNLIFLALAISILVDIDHLFDYFLYYGLSLHSPISGSNYFCLSGKLYILLHAWEYLPLILFLALYFKKLKAFLITIFLSLAGHYFLDQFTNSIYPLGYLLIYRLVNNFDINIASWGCLL